MPFAFKLSQRLARMHDRSLSSSAACRLLSVADPRLPVPKFVVSLDAIALFPRATHHTPCQVAPSWAPSADNQ